jgi:hypothetical protein
MPAVPTSAMEAAGSDRPKPQWVYLEPPATTVLGIGRYAGPRNVAPSITGRTGENTAEHTAQQQLAPSHRSAAARIAA